MRRALILTCLGLMACEADTGGLVGDPVGDAGSTAGVEAGVDAGHDAGVDAGHDAGHDAGSTAGCRIQSRFGMEFSGIDRDGHAGRVRIESLDPLIIEVGNELVTVVMSGDQPPLPFSAGDVLLARMEFYRPFWTESRLTLWEIGPDDGPGALLLQAWSGSSYREGVEDAIDYAYVDAECVYADDFCGERIGRGLRIRLSGVELLVPPGSRLEQGPMIVLNGASERYPSPPQCTDTPNDWYEGWIAIERQAPEACSTMQRDDCIADPRCVLWGSETSDPGYVCVDAVSDCERIPDQRSCSGAPLCQWDPGGCYCPEGIECACGGGPAPKCRDTCGGFAGAVCPAGRYCDDASVAPPMCVPPPDSAGICERIPLSCTGSPRGPVCGCLPGAPGGAAGFDNDCLRRQAQASGSVPNGCM